MTRVVDLPPKRGKIIGRKGWELVRDSNARSLYASPAEIEDPDQAADNLSSICKVNRSILYKRLTSKNLALVVVKRRLSDKEVEEVERLKIPGLRFIDEAERFYPNGSLAAHVVGQVSIDQDGQGGVEQFYNQLLRGKPGRAILDLTADNHVYDIHEEPALEGANLFTTLDETMQTKVEILLNQALYGSSAHFASAIIMDPHTGEILALANVPGFDPNKRPQNDKDMILQRNRATEYIFELGPIFDPIAYSIAVEEGLAQLKDPSSSYPLELRFLNLDNPLVSSRKGPRLSGAPSGLPAYLALRIGRNRFENYIKSFGLGGRTGIDLPAEATSIRRFKKTAFRRGAGATETVYDINCSALQILSAMAVIANRGVWVQPHIVNHIESQQGVIESWKPNERRVISEATAKQVAEMLNRKFSRTRVVESPTMQPPRVTVLEKSTERFFDTRQTRIVTVVVGFAPSDNPKRLVIVTFEHAQRSSRTKKKATQALMNIIEAAMGGYELPPLK